MRAGSRKNSNRLGANERRRLQKRRERRVQKVTQAGRWAVGNAWKWFIVLGVCVGLGWGVWQGIRLIEWNKLFAIRQVKVEGVRWARSEDVLNASGIEIGFSMWGLPKDSIASRIEKLELVESVDVRRLFPNIVVLQIKEVEPLFVTSSPKGLSVWSTKGTFMPITKEEGVSLPIVSARSDQQRQVAVSILATMRNADPLLYQKVSQLVVDNVESWGMVYFRDYSSKVLFSSDNISRKSCQQYRLLVQGMKEQIAKVIEIDMRFPGMAIAIPAKSEKHDG